MSEFAVARNPKNPNHLVIGAMDWDDEGGTVGCVTFLSRDGGMSWSPGGRVPGLEKGYLQADPWVTIDRKGRAHLQCLQIVAKVVDNYMGTFVDGTSGRPSLVVQHARSDDGGETWSQAKRIPPRNPKNQVDKNAIYASLAGTLYACVNDYGRAGDATDDLVVSRSFNGGKSWTKPTSLDSQIGIDGPDGTGFGNCNGFAEGPKGEIYLLWAAIFPDGASRFGTAVTLDRGKTWTSATIDQPGAPPFPSQTSTPGGFVSMWPSVAADPITGAAFVAKAMWNGDRYETRLYRSDDSGSTYQEVVLPPIPSTNCQECHGMNPAVTVDASGRLGLQVMLTSDSGLDKELWFLVSEDRGNTWLEPVQVSSTGSAQSWLDPRNWMPSGTAPVTAILNRDPESAANLLAWDAAGRASQGPAGPGAHLRYGGDYWTITSSPLGFVALWEDHAENGKQQLWARIINVDGTLSGPVLARDTSASIVQNSEVAIASSRNTESRRCHSRSWKAAEFARAVSSDNPVRVLAEESGSELVALEKVKDRVWGTIQSNRGVLGTFRSYQQTLSEQGFEFVLADYEGFEAELFGAGKDQTVLVRILESCNSSVASVMLTR